MRWTNPTKELSWLRSQIRLAHLELDRLERSHKLAPELRRELSIVGRLRRIKSVELEDDVREIEQRADKDPELGAGTSDVTKTLRRRLPSSESPQRGLRDLLAFLRGLCPLLAGVSTLW